MRVLLCLDSRLGRCEIMCDHDVHESETVIIAVTTDQALRLKINP